jgi:hypothetical protein
MVRVASPSRCNTSNVLRGQPKQFFSSLISAIEAVLGLPERR